MSVISIMKKFIDRELEMEALQREYDWPGSALVVMYGRRRVGKTTLIAEFIKDKKAFFSCQRGIRSTEQTGVPRQDAGVYRQ